MENNEIKLLKMWAILEAISAFCLKNYIMSKVFKTANQFFFVLK